MRVANNKDVGLVLVDFIESFLLSQKISFKKIFARTKPYTLAQIGVVRSKIVNDGTLFSVFNNYFIFCGFKNHKYLAKIISHMNSELMAKTFSALNTFAKKEVSQYYEEKDWIKLCELSTLTGYPKNSHRVFKNGKDDLKYWLCSDVEPNINITKEQVASNIQKLIGVPFTNNVTKFHFTSFKDWLFARWTWMNDGASKYSKLFVDDEKVKTKKGAALSLSDTELLALATRDSILKDGLRAFVKSDEKGLKGRYVVNAPIGMYLQQKFYIDYLIAATTYKSPVLGMFRGGSDKITTIQNSIHMGDSHIPVDFESFDHKVKRVYWDGFQLYLRQHLTGDYLEAAETVYSLFDNIEVYDIDGASVGKWTKGLPSGLYATAFCGSLFNAVAQLFAEQFSGGRFKPLFAQGDDGDIIDLKKDVSDALPAIAEAFDQTGFIVNPQKNWFKVGATEFLKQVITTDSVFQYPARAFSTLAWAFPGSFKNNTIINKLVTLATSWKEVFDRFAFDYEKLMINDIFEAVKSKLSWSRKTVYHWIHCPPAMGGFGLLPLNFNYMFKFKSEEGKQTIKGSRWPRFIIPNTQIKDLKMFKTDVNKKINTQNHKMPNIYQATLKYNPNFSDYIEFIRAISGKPNKLPTNISMSKEDSSIPFRKIGWSDTYVQFNSGNIRVKGITENYILVARLYSSPAEHIGIQQKLWK